MPVYQDISLLELQYAHRGAQRRGLARAVLSDKAVNIARADVEGKMIHRPLVARIRFRKVFDL